MYYIAQD